MIRSELILVAAEEGHSANPLLPNWWEVLVTAVGFAVLMFLVVKYIAPALEKAYQDRVDAIEGGLEKAEKAQAEANALKASYEQQQQDGYVEANRIREEARAEAAQILADAREKASTEAARIAEQAQAQIAAERVQAEASLRTDVGSLATTLASRIVGESLEDDARAQRVVDRFLEDLERSEATGRTATSAGAAE
ncbi:F0F1 ATP synthase subunit B [Citricoccus sp. SGAir0253]|uniref:F0F1 ATP synthase subunit B n=1 Tax=Citricoccus sp. SGAir0253 TaxID=2567881 RepID=UPI0010CD3BA7|nr:F0F1 ATP synthase subunit B [Citricoccus sp. SGAir0253]QCU78417.1 F0F1 ATP synthase subunit B [Citricoccus sp. SGAir0253]